MPALLAILIVLIFLRLLIKLPGFLRWPLSFEGCLLAALPFVLMMLIVSMLLL